MRAAVGLSLSSTPKPSSGGATTIAQLNLSCWVRELSTTLPWVGVASAGVSGDGSHNVVHQTTDPTTGTALNGHTVATFNGTTQCVKQNGAQGNYHSTTNFCGWAVLKPTDPGHTAVFFDGQAGGSYQISFATGTGNVAIDLDGGVPGEALRACGFGTFKVLTWRWDGAKLQIGINEVPGAAGGASSLVYATPAANITNTAFLGGSPSFASNRWAGDLAEYAESPVRLSDADFTMAVAELRARYAI